MMIWKHIIKVDFPIKPKISFSNQPSKNQKPVLEEQGKKKKIPVVEFTEKEQKQLKWNFSFRFWQQIKFFGLDKTDNQWFVSLLERLKILSAENRVDILENHNVQQNFRYHKINWKQKNIPIKKTELNWIDKDYLENSQEYEFYQFQISLALGRIIGFWDENFIFNIVLLDPLHNIQPSKSYGYKVDNCDKLQCKYSSLLHDIKNIKSLDELEYIPNKNNFNILMHFINESLYEKIDELIENGKIDNVEDLLEFGVECLNDNSSSEV